MDEEQFCYAQIRQIKEEYDRRIKPWVDRLIAIKSLEVRPHLLVNINDLTPAMRKTLEELTAPQQGSKS